MPDSSNKTVYVYSDTQTLFSKFRAVTYSWLT
jgi:hypothetical protein